LLRRSFFRYCRSEDRVMLNGLRQNRFLSESQPGEKDAENE